MQTTKKHVEGAFKRLCRAMEWPHGPAWIDGKAQIGVAMLSEGYRSWGIQIMSNEAGGVHCPFPSWGSKREAFDTMASMATAVELYKRGYNKGA